MMIAKVTQKTIFLPVVTLKTWFKIESVLMCSQKKCTRGVDIYLFFSSYNKNLVLDKKSFNNYVDKKR